jgi:hypothetical protein
MSNGNSSEEQQAEQLSPGAAEAAADERDRQARLKADQARKLQALKLMRARICEQLARTTNERYLDLLNTELQQIDGELAKLV